MEINELAKLLIIAVKEKSEFPHEYLSEYFNSSTDKHKSLIYLFGACCNLPEGNNISKQESGLIYSILKDYE